MLRDLLAAPAGPLARISIVEEVGSTTTALVDAIRSEPQLWPLPALLVARHQTNGRGRLGRQWQTEPGTAVTMSVATRPEVDPSLWSWVPLLTGLGTVHALRATCGVAARLKWPNDVVIPVKDAEDLHGWGADRKVAGILVERHDLPEPTLVIGIGINVLQGPEQLPVPSATSLLLAGARAPEVMSVEVAVVRSLVEIAQRWQATGGDVRAAGLADEVAAVCGTLGKRVSVDLPGGRRLVGTASRLASDGGLVVEHDGGETVVRAGDVLHVRGDE